MQWYEDELTFYLKLQLLQEKLSLKLSLREVEQYLVTEVSKANF